MSEEEPELVPAEAMPADEPGRERPADAEPMSETAADIEDLEVGEPRVAILMGSKSDLPAMEKAEAELKARGIRSETRVMSAHREPDVVAD